MSAWILTYQQSVFERYHSNKDFSECYPLDGCENQLAAGTKLRHCHPVCNLCIGLLQARRRRRRRRSVTVRRPVSCRRQPSTPLTQTRRPRCCSAAPAHQPRPTSTRQSSQRLPQTRDLHHPAPNLTTRRPRCCSAAPTHQVRLASIQQQRRSSQQLGRCNCLVCLRHPAYNLQKRTEAYRLPVSITLLVTNFKVKIDRLLSGSAL